MGGDFFGELFTALQVYGYLGAFLISVLGSVIPFLPVPYLIPIVLMAETLNPFLLGIAAGVGGAVGKLTSYTLGRLGGRFLGSESRRRMSALSRTIDRYGALAVFLFALTPLPDDVIYIPIGLARLNLLKFMVANALGKIVLSWIVAYGGRTYFEVARSFLGEGEGLTAVVAALVAMILISIALFRIDWEDVVESARRKGLKAALESAIASLRGKKK